MTEGENQLPQAVLHPHLYTQTRTHNKIIQNKKTKIMRPTGYDLKSPNSQTKTTFLFINRLPGVLVIATES